MFQKIERKQNNIVRHMSQPRIEMIQIYDVEKNMKTVKIG